MLGQAAGNAFGLHLLKQTDSGINAENLFDFTVGQTTGVSQGNLTSQQGDLPPELGFLVGVKGEPTRDRYLDNVDPFGRKANTLTLNDNRLVALSRLFNQFYLTEDEKLSGTVNIGRGSLIALNEGENLITYPGGPGSVFGATGNTNIPKLESIQRTGENNSFLLGTGFFGEGFGGTLQGGSFNLLRIARQGASFVQGGLDKLGRKKGFLGFIGNALATQVPSLFDKGAQGIDNFIRNSISNALGLSNLAPQSNYTVFQRPTPTFNFINYVRLSNVFGAIESSPLIFNDINNAINADGSRGPTFDFNVYVGANIAENNPQLQNANGGASWTQKNILEAPDLITPGTIGEDFRKTIKEERGKGNVKTVISNSPSYPLKNFMRRTQTGDAGDIPFIEGEGRSIFNYGVDGSTLSALDRLNALQAYDGSVDSNKPINDLVKLRFRIINNDGGLTNLHFRSFINSFTDNYSSQWNSLQYVGRGDNFYNYQGFNRSINIGFTVAATSKAELVPMYKKLNQLAATLAPDYSSGGYMRGNLVKFTMGDYLNDVPGFLNSVNITIPQDSPFEIAINEDGGADSSVGELPLIVNVECQFTPIHDFLVEKAQDNDNPNAKYISLKDGDLYSLYQNISPEKYSTDGPTAEQVQTQLDLIEGRAIIDASQRRIQEQGLLGTAEERLGNYLNTNSPAFSKGKSLSGRFNFGSTAGSSNLLGL